MSVIITPDLSLETLAQNVLYEDNHLLGLFKPAGMLTQGDSTGRLSLLDLGKLWLQQKYQKPGQAFLGLLHRLDRPVSGVVLFAKTSKSARRLSEQFRNRRIVKIYLAVVEGHPAPPEGISKVYLIRQGSKSVLTTPGRATAQSAELSYKTLKTGPRASLVQVIPATGRRHQIRAQLAALGHPIYGDRNYGSSHGLADGVISLQAQSLTFHHPISAEQITLTAPPPQGRPWSLLE
ncbi:MAG: RluA family pseudouridine synthase [Deltaproteobacteria bacterium]|nr:RluA family pseudouridine synthase [Deltaproteobacteria bacterium]